jgi:hypothetical protein
MFLIFWHSSVVPCAFILTNATLKWLPQLICLLQSQVFRFLKTLREKGKKLFLLTNSPFYFVDGGMSYLLEVPIYIQIVLCFSCT